jgi:hypothetical protein
MSVDPQNKTAELIRRLTKRTDERKIRWAPQSDDGTAFTVTLENGSVSLISQDGDGLPPTVLEILNPDGVVVHRTESEIRRADPANNPIFALWLAVQQASGPAGPVIDGLLDELDDTLPF